MSSIYTKVGIASVIMMGSVFLSRVIGLVREMVIAYFGGAGAAVDAYQVAFILPEILNHILASGFLSITFIPIFAGYLAQNREAEGWRTFSLILTCFGFFLLLLVTVAMILAPKLLAVAGFEDPQVLDQAIAMTRIIIPAQLFFFAGGLLMAVQFAKERFLIPALAPLIYNLGIIGGGVVLGPYLGMKGFAWGVLVGAFFGNFLLQWLGAARTGLRFRPLLKLRHPDLKRYILLTLPLMVGLTMTFSTEVFSRIFGSHLPAGSVASLNYCLRVMFVLVGVFGQAVGVASYPFLSRLASENRLPEMNRLLNQTLGLLLLVIPVAVLMIVLRHEIVLLLFQRGAFDAADTAKTAVVLPYVLVGAAAFAAQTVVVRGFYAMQNTLFPTVFGTLAVMASLPFFFMGMQWLGIKGVALALSFSAILQVALLYWLWNHKTGNAGAPVYRVLVKSTLLAVPLGYIFDWIRSGLESWVDTGAASGCLLMVLLVGSGYLALLLVLGTLFRFREMGVLIEALKRRVPGIR